MTAIKKTGDAAEHLKSEADIRLYLDAAFVGGDPATIRTAVAVAAFARARLSAPSPSAAPRQPAARRSASRGSAPDQQ
jgi:hypothetical protein